MASGAKKRKRIRARKAAPNKANLKTNMKRIEKNIEILRDLSAKDEK